MIKEIKMPNLGTTTNEIKIVRWLKKENDAVKRGEALFEVETDKAAMEVESYLAGYLKKIVTGEQESAAVGAVVAYIGDEADVMEQPQAAEVKPAREDSAPTEEKKASAVRISPMVRKIAEKLGVDYTAVNGTGPDGMIMKEDIEKAAAGGAASPAPKEEAKVSGLIPFDRIGKATANAMSLSKTTIPHVYFTVEVDTTAMKALREKSGKEFSYNAMLIKAVADCIRKYPYFAAKYSDEGRVISDTVNIGLAAAREDDLIVPVIADADKGGLKEVETKVREVVGKVKSNTLQQKDISDGVFTVTNLGGYGIDSFTAVINPPEAAILAVGRIADKLVPVEGGIRVQPSMALTLSVDHRIINGAYAANFLKELKSTLEGMKTE
jgi:pyruvate dehydrogenase E2 component (dihydrolipoamide acetyltransferase)